MAASGHFLRTPAGAPTTLLTAALYCGFSLLLLRTGDEGGIAVFCCADAVLLTTLLLRPSTEWHRPVIGCILVDIVANLVTGRSAPIAIAFGFGNMVTPVFAAMMLRLLAGEQAARIDVPLSVARFAVVVGGAASALGALVGATILRVGFGLPFATTWLGWYATEASSMMLSTPLFLLLWSPDFARRARGLLTRRGLLACSLTAAVSAGSLFTFSHQFAPLLFIPALLVVIAAFGAGPATVAASVLVVTLIGGFYVGIPGGQLALVSGGMQAEVIYLQCYLAVVLLTSLPVAASLKERERLAFALASSERRFRALAENSSDLIILLDVGGRCTYASPAAQEVMGLSAEDLIGLTLARTIDTVDREEVLTRHRAVLASPGIADTITYRATHADGRLIWFEARARAIVDAKGAVAGAQWIVRDVSAHKSVEAMLSEAADTDPLTGLANRRAFFRSLETAIAQARRQGSPLALAIIDADHFKRINDNWGHETGDLALKLMASACQASVRGGDLLARLGGEEFALAMPDTSRDRACRAGDRLRKAVAAIDIPLPEGGCARVTISIGLALLGCDDDAKELMRAADRALYAAKAGGRDRIESALRDGEPQPLSQDAASL